MKKKLIILFVLLVNCSVSNTKLTPVERDFAINELNNSKGNLLDILNGLSEAQLNFKINKSSWSILQCTEHITILENEVFEILKESLELPSDPERRKDLKFTDKELIAHVHNRTEKTKTQKDFEPIGKYGNHKTTIAEFKTKREQHINYIKTTEDDLRNHFANFGSIDLYQVFLYMSSHTNRHIEQIKEIKNDKNFPKN
ncbi:DinB family protein [Aquimarina sp. AU58]|uniref:DinB family protein n=1 Tax=Aquimarina sp. AU58 TaxID=1874112 RepID=UPI000D6DE1CF|nr:DinB family protein [Aquimarina sp. AU58]